MQRKTIFRWGMIALVIMLLAQLVMFTNHARAVAPGLNVQGRFLYDKNGTKIILYGINHMIFWTDLDGVPSYAEMAKTGANSVRIQWLTTGTADQLDTAITNCRAERMIPMIELHDATGKWDQLSTLVDYWVKPEIVAVIQKHQEYLMVNIGNEVGSSTIADADFISGYTTAVQRMRTAGIHVPLVIDAANYGQDINGLQATGPTLTQNDPDHNLMFSIHFWWPYEYNHTDQEIIDEIAQSVNMNLPLVIGEFGNRVDDNAQGIIPYKLIMQQAYQNQIGYLPWSWGPGNNPQTWLDMTTDMTYATLNGWGLEVAVTDQYSIKNIAVRPAWMDTIPPTAVPTTVPSNLVSYNKPVTVSSVRAGTTNTGPNAVDGNSGSRWESEYSDPQWISVDLGSAYPITNAELVWEGAYAAQYKLQISNDNSTWTDVLAEYNGNGGTDTIAVNQTARYVRMYGTQRTNSSWGYSLWEFRVFSGSAVLTNTPTITPTGPTPTPTRTNTPTITPTITLTRTATNTPTITLTPTITNVPAPGLQIKLQNAGTESSSLSSFNLQITNTGAAALSNITWRLYFTTENGNAASDYILEKYYDQSGVAAISGPTLACGSTYYYTVSYGATTLPVGSTWAYNTGFHLGSYASTYDASNDWWHTGYAVGSLPSAFALDYYLPGYVNGSLLWGNEPNCSGGTVTSTPTSTFVATNTPTRTATNTLTPAMTNTPTRTPTRTLTPAISNTPTRTPTRTFTPAITNTPTRTPTRTLTPAITNTPTRTPTPTITLTQGTGSCSPITSTITAPFTFDGAGTFCWQSSNLGAYINSWNTTSVTLNGVNVTNAYIASGSYPAQIGGYWYVSYNSSVAWGHFEAK